MATYLVLARRDYPDPLELIEEVTCDHTPTLDDIDGAQDWLELVVAPADSVIWIQRDGEVVGDHHALEGGPMSASAVSGQAGGQPRRDSAEVGR